MAACFSPSVSLNLGPADLAHFPRPLRDRSRLFPFPPTPFRQGQGQGQLLPLLTRVPWILRAPYSIATVPRGSDFAFPVPSSVAAEHGIGSRIALGPLTSVRRSFACEDLGSGSDGNSDLKCNSVVCFQTRDLRFLHEKEVTHCDSSVNEYFP